MNNDLISRQAAIDAFWSLDAELRPSAIDAILNMLNELPSAQNEKKGETMSEIVREMTREELVASNNELRAENEKLKAELQEAIQAAEHNRHVAEENQLKRELYYRDGVIFDMKICAQVQRSKWR